MVSDTLNAMKRDRYCLFFVPGRAAGHLAVHRTREQKATLKANDVYGVTKGPLQPGRYK